MAPTKKIPAKKPSSCHLNTVHGYQRLTTEEQVSVSSMFAGLEPRQQRFALEYLADLNASQAAIRAGYSARTASEQGTRLLAKVGLMLAPLLQAQQAQLAEESGITRKRWLMEIQRTAFFDVRTLFDQHGNAIDIPDLSDEAAAAVAGFELVEEFEGRGEARKRIGYTKKYKFVDKLHALKVFGEATGYLAELGSKDKPIQHHMVVEFV